MHCTWVLHTYTACDCADVRIARHPLNLVRIYPHWLDPPFPLADVLCARAHSVSIPLVATHFKPLVSKTGTVFPRILLHRFQF
jgi:hypothetical protein